MAGDTQGRNVLIVDDDPANLRLLVALLKRGGLVPRPVTSGRLAIEAAVADPPDLVLLDVAMPEMSGLEVCRWFKQDARLQHIPVIIISGSQGSHEMVDAFYMGGIDYVSKPFQDQEVLARVKTHLRMSRMQMELRSQNLQLDKRMAEQVKLVRASQLATMFALAKLAQARHHDTSHIGRVQALATALAEQMRNMNLQAGTLTLAFIDNLHHAAPIHDIGEVGTPDIIMRKPGKLSAEEFGEMKKHCELGGNTLTAVQDRYPENKFLRMAVGVARSHHEKWDGSGYPDGLRSTAIPLAARIVALADCYDALTSQRSYRCAFSHQDSCRMIQKGSSTHFDPDVVAAFSLVKSQFRLS